MYCARHTPCNKEPMKLWLLLSRFEYGGLERVQANIAPALKSSGWDTTIVAGKFIGNAKDIISKEIPTLEISPHGKKSFALNLLIHLSRDRPDIVLTTSNDVSCLVLAFRSFFFPKMKVICTQHLSLSAPLRSAHALQRIKHHFLIWLMRVFWPRADSVVAVSSALACDVESTLKLKSTVKTIYNPIVLPDFEENSRKAILWPWPDGNIPTIIFAGRLAKVKRLDILLNAFLQVQQRQDARLLILGEGPEQQYINSFIKRHHLDNICHLLSHQTNPLPWIKKANVLVLPSDYEGFGNVLVEAMACGTQVIATNCPSGPSEILSDGEYGQLIAIGNADALAHAIQLAVSNKFHVPSQKLIARAKNFDLERASNAYSRLIQEVAQLP